MDAKHKAARYLSGLIFLASILLFIDYYLPAQQRLLIIDSTTTHSETVGNRYGQTRINQNNYGYAGDIKVAENNFPCISFREGDTIILSTSPIHKIQTNVIGLSGFNRGALCNAEYNPFVLKGLFILLPMLLALGAIMSKDRAIAMIGSAVAATLYIAAISSIFIL